MSLKHGMGVKVFGVVLTALLFLCVPLKSAMSQESGSSDGGFEISAGVGYVGMFHKYEGADETTKLHGMAFHLSLGYRWDWIGIALDVSPAFSMEKNDDDKIEVSAGIIGYHVSALFDYDLGGVSVWGKFGLGLFSNQMSSVFSMKVQAGFSCRLNDVLSLGADIMYAPIFVRDEVIHTVAPSAHVRIHF
ncbi:MAG: porin family protein [Proteobacteria bacterium]|nr:porin family protein [Pseudomonadota bacterium]